MTGKQWLDRPVLPYLLLAVSPVLTLPIGTVILLSLPDCGVDEPWWELRYFEIALLPALADLFPFLWPASRKPTVRKAAIVAGLIGSARYRGASSQHPDLQRIFRWAGLKSDMLGLLVLRGGSTDSPYPRTVACLSTGGCRDTAPSCAASAGIDRHAQRYVIPPVLEALSLFAR